VDELKVEDDDEEVETPEGSIKCVKQSALRIISSISDTNSTPSHDSVDLTIDAAAVRPALETQMSTVSGLARRARTSSTTRRRRSTKDSIVKPPPVNKASNLMQTETAETGRVSRQ
jgi:hypothetical protein